MAAVQRRNGEQIEGLLRRFRKQCDRAGIMPELQSREFYVKPSEKKQRAKNRAVKAQRRKIRYVSGTGR